jgi:hypothetical protein
MIRAVEYRKLSPSSWSKSPLTHPAGIRCIEIRRTYGYGNSAILREKCKEAVRPNSPAYRANTPKRPSDLPEINLSRCLNQTVTRNLRCPRTCKNSRNYTTLSCAETVTDCQQSLCSRFESLSLSLHAGRQPKRKPNFRAILLARDG